MAIVSFIPLFLVDTFSAGKETAAASISLVYFMGLWAGPVSGYLSDRFGQVAIIIIMCAIASVAIYFLNVAPYGFGTVSVLISIGIIMAFSSIMAQAYIVNQTSARNRSTVLGFYFFGSMEGTGVLTPALGYVIDRFGFSMSYTISSVAIMAILIVCSSILWLNRK
jgi:MFS family permease